MVIKKLVASIARRKKQALHVGSRVKLDFGGRKAFAIVIEDRGHVGVGGRRLLRVRVEIADVAETD